MQNFFFQQKASILITISLLLIQLFSSTLATGQENTEQTTKQNSRQKITSRQTEQKAMQFYMQLSGNKEARWMNQAKEPYILWYKDTAETKSMGMLVLIAGMSGISPNKPLMRIYQELPDLGWSSAAALMPPKERKKPTIRTTNTTPKATEEKKAETSDTTVTNFDTQDQNKKTVTPEDKKENPTEITAQERINISSSFLLENNTKWLTYIADNNTVTAAIEASINNSEDVSGLILWQVSNETLLNTDLEKLKQSRVTLLDFTSNDLSKKELNERIRKMKKAEFIKDYQQYSLPIGEASVNYGLKRIKNWLESQFVE